MTEKLVRVKSAKNKLIIEPAKNVNAQEFIISR